MSMKIRAPRRMMSEINAVPYIDVMLVLLVVFMITAPMMVQGIGVELPRTGDEPLDLDDQEPVIVSVDSEGRYFIDVGEDTHEATTLESVRERASRIQRNAPGTQFLVEGDEEVPYGRVIALMSALQGAGIERLGLVTQPPDRT